MMKYNRWNVLKIQSSYCTKNISLSKKWKPCTAWWLRNRTESDQQLWPSDRNFDDTHGCHVAWSNVMVVLWWPTWQLPEQIVVQHRISRYPLFFTSFSSLNDAIDLFHPLNNFHLLTLHDLPHLFIGSYI